MKKILESIALAAIIVSMVIVLLPNSFFWDYKSITTNKTTYEVGELIESDSLIASRGTFPITWNDNLRCISRNWHDTYVVTAVSEWNLKWEGNRTSTWTYWRTLTSPWWESTHTMCDCYIKSTQKIWYWFIPMTQTFFSNHFDIGDCPYED